MGQWPYAVGISYPVANTESILCHTNEHTVVGERTTESSVASVGTQSQLLEGTQYGVSGGSHTYILHSCSLTTMIWVPTVHVCIMAGSIKM